MMEIGYPLSSRDVDSMNVSSFHNADKRTHRKVMPLGACPNSRCSILSESDSTLGYEQVTSSNAAMSSHDATFARWIKSQILKTATTMTEPASGNLIELRVL
jgi:hypothetical protein